jgi:hypothetical protein
MFPKKDCITINKFKKMPYLHIATIKIKYKLDDLFFIEYLIENERER